MHINRPRHDDYAPEGSGMAAVALALLPYLAPRPNRRERHV
jgi:hypothetical protein